MFTHYGHIGNMTTKVYYLCPINWKQCKNYSSIKLWAFKLTGHRSEKLPVFHFIIVTTTNTSNNSLPQFPPFPVFGGFFVFFLYFFAVKKKPKWFMNFTFMSCWNVAQKPTYDHVIVGTCCMRDSYEVMVYGLHDDENSDGVLWQNYFNESSSFRNICQVNPNKLNWKVDNLPTENCHVPFDCCSHSITRALFAIGLWVLEIVACFCLC